MTPEEWSIELRVRIGRAMSEGYTNDDIGPIVAKAFQEAVAEAEKDNARIMAQWKQSIQRLRDTEKRVTEIERELEATQKVRDNFRDMMERYHGRLTDVENRAEEAKHLFEVGVRVRNQLQAKIAEVEKQVASMKCVLDAARELSKRDADLEDTVCNILDAISKFDEAQNGCKANCGCGCAGYGVCGCGCPEHSRK